MIKFSVLVVVSLGIIFSCSTGQRNGYLHNFTGHIGSHSPSFKVVTDGKTSTESSNFSYSTYSIAWNDNSPGVGTGVEFLYGSGKFDSISSAINPISFTNRTSSTTSSKFDKYDSSIIYFPLLIYYRAKITREIYIIPIGSLGVHRFKAWPTSNDSQYIEEWSAAYRYGVQGNYYFTPQLAAHVGVEYFGVYPVGSDKTSTDTHSLSGNLKGGGMLWRLGVTLAFNKVGTDDWDEEKEQHTKVKRKKKKEVEEAYEDDEEEEEEKPRKKRKKSKKARSKKDDLDEEEE